MGPNDSVAQHAYCSPPDHAIRSIHEHEPPEVCADELAEPQSDKDDATDSIGDSLELSYADVSDGDIETQCPVEVSDKDELNPSFDDEETDER